MNYLQQEQHIGVGFNSKLPLSRHVLSRTACRGVLTRTLCPFSRIVNRLRPSIPLCGKLSASSALTARRKSAFPVDSTGLTLAGSRVSTA